MRLAEYSHEDPPRHVQVTSSNQVSVGSYGKKDQDSRDHQQQREKHCLASCICATLSRPSIRGKKLPRSTLVRLPREVPDFVAPLRV